MKKITCSLVVLLSAFVLGQAPVSGATVYSTTLSAANEVPPIASSGTGTALVTLDGNSLNVAVNFSGLTSAAGAGHIHCCGPLGTNQAIAVPFTTFPIGTMNGTYNNTFDLTLTSSYNAPFLATYGGVASAAGAALIAALNAGQTYVNVHTTSYPGGEIRGQLAPVPEPATLWLGAIALGGFALWRARAGART